jgi:hypothetical protein
MQYIFKFYLQIFTGVKYGFLMSRGTCPICKQFRPESYEACPHLWSQPLLLSVPLFLPNLQEDVKQKLPGDLNQAIVVAKLLFHEIA